MALSEMVQFLSYNLILSSAASVEFSVFIASVVDKVVETTNTLKVWHLILGSFS